ncbi:hypothetical protein PTKIN_Ptkin01aG0091100 [Pterospermum kingtungense]
MNNKIYACENINASCDPIQPGGVCYYPNTPINHASVANEHLLPRTWPSRLGMLL